MTVAARCRTRVVKLGGSLLAWPNLAAVMRDWLAGQPPAINILIAGGGELADYIRVADAVHSLGEENSHNLCVGLLNVSAQLAGCLFPEACVRTTLNELRQDAIGGPDQLVIFNPRDFLDYIDPICSKNPLPHTWQVTSDSIAARVAEAIAADELVLLKSADLPEHHSLSDLASQGYVDGFFPVAAEPLVGRIRFVNLRGYENVRR